jgi:mannosyl-3-phosphoglycerate phosphatase
MERLNRKLIIFTDLDGTLLDDSYSFQKALPALRLIRKKNVPLIICSSKTGTEIVHIRRMLNNRYPFISENGGGIYIPKSYFKLKVYSSKLKITELKNYFLIQLGTSYSDLRKVLLDLRSEGFDVTGFGDCTVKELSALTGLKPAAAKMAKQREFDEVFVFRGNSTALRKLKRRIRGKGFNYTQGVFFHITGENDKGRAVEILSGLCRKQYGKVFTAALGDSPNDREMLRAVDYPIAVRKTDGSYDKQLKVKGLNRSEGIGPEGWNQAVIQLLEQHGP